MASQAAAEAAAEALDTMAHGGQGGPRIADAQQLDAFARLPEGERPALDGAMRGVLSETALAGRVRYEWRLLSPLLHRLLDSVLEGFAGERAEDVGPPRPMLAGDTPEAARQRLHQLLDAFPAPPFTLQRLCELLLEPRKQYLRLDKLVQAVERLLLVTSTLEVDPAPPLLPNLASLAAVNDNPRSPYLYGPDGQLLPSLVPQLQPNGANSGDAEFTYYVSPAAAAAQASAAGVAEGKQQLGSTTGANADGRFYNRELDQRAASTLMDAEGEPPVQGPLPLRPAEAMQAEAFAEAALADDPSAVGVGAPPADAARPVEDAEEAAAGVRRPVDAEAAEPRLPVGPAAVGERAAQGGAGSGPSNVPQAEGTAEGALASVDAGEHSAHEAVPMEVRQADGSAEVDAGQCRSAPW